MTPATPYAIDVTDAGQSLGALLTTAGATLPPTILGVWLSAPDANHAKGVNAGTLFIGNASAQHTAIPSTEVTGNFYPFDDLNNVYVKSSTSGDSIIVQPLH